MIYTVNGWSTRETKETWKDFRKGFQKDPTFQTVDRGVFKVDNNHNFSDIYRLVAH